MAIHHNLISWRRVSAAGFAALLLLVLPQCAGKPPQVLTESCGGRSCSGTSDCQVNVPLCGQSSTAYCLPDAPRECAWRLIASSTCRCLEHDVRLCTASGGVPGVQICTANAGRTATDWAACVACPSCT